MGTRTTVALALLLAGAAGAEERVELVYAVDPAPSIDEAAAVVSRRLAKWGMGAASKRGQELVVVLPAVRDDDELQTIERLIAARGAFEVAPVVEGSATMAALAARVRGDLDASRAVGIELRHDSWSGRHRKAHEDVYLAAPDRVRAQVSPEEARELGCDPRACVVSGRTVLERVVRRSGVDAGAVGYERMVVTLSYSEPRWRTYVLDLSQKRALSIVDVKVGARFAVGRLEPDLRVTFAPESARQLSEMSGRHLDGKLALLVDGEVSSAPVVSEKLTGRSSQVLVTRAPTDDAWLRAVFAQAIVFADPLAATLTRTVRTAMPIPPFTDRATCRRQCEAGVASSCASAGDHASACRSGRLDSCEKACADSSEACAELARVIASGPARLQNREVVVKLHDRTCAAGHEPSCAALEEMLQERRRAEREENERMKQFLRSN